MTHRNPMTDADLASRIDARAKSRAAFLAAEPRQARPPIPLADLYQFHVENDHLPLPALEGKVYDRFDIPLIRYFQQLFRHADTVEALQLDPVLTHRIQDQRDRRAAARASRGRTTTTTGVSE